MVSRCTVHTGSWLCEGKKLAGKITEPLRGEINADDRNQLVGTDQHRHLAVSRHLKDSATMTVSRFAIIIHQDCCTTLQHEKRIVKLPRRNEELGGEARLGLDNRRCQQRSDLSLRLVSKRRTSGRAWGNRDGR